MHRVNAGCPPEQVSQHTMQERMERRKGKEWGGRGDVKPAESGVSSGVVCICGKSEETRCSMRGLQRGKEKSPFLSEVSYDAHSLDTVHTFLAAGVGEKIGLGHKC